MKSKSFLSICIVILIAQTTSKPTNTHNPTSAPSTSPSFASSTLPTSVPSAIPISLNSNSSSNMTENIEAALAAALNISSAEPELQHTTDNETVGVIDAGNGVNDTAITYMNDDDTPEANTTDNPEIEEQESEEEKGIIEEATAIESVKSKASRSDSFWDILGTPRPTAAPISLSNDDEVKQSSFDPGTMSDEEPSIDEIHPGKALYFYYDFFPFKIKVEYF